MFADLLGGDHGEFTERHDRRDLPRPVERVVEAAVLMWALVDEVGLEPMSEFEISPFRHRECIVADQRGQFLGTPGEGQEREELGSDLEMVVAGASGTGASPHEARER